MMVAKTSLSCILKIIISLITLLVGKVISTNIYSPLSVVHIHNVRFGHIYLRNP